MTSEDMLRALLELLDGHDDKHCEVKPEPSMGVMRKQTIRTIVLEQSFSAIIDITTGKCFRYFAFSTVIHDLS